MEGFETKVLNKEFGLHKKGYTGKLIVPIGYRDTEKDHNFDRPKSHLFCSEILTEI